MFYLDLCHCVRRSIRAAEYWPQFRGPNGDGMSDATGLPVTFGEKENLRWKIAIHGKGWSSPVVLGNQIWLTTATPDGKELYVMCVDLNSGKIKHDMKLLTLPNRKPLTNSTAMPRRRRSLKADRVYVHFGAPERRLWIRPPER